MKGIICLWGGAIEDIPAGWHLCDGNDGTPDLRNKFIMAAGDAYSPGDTGGSDTYMLAAGVVIASVAPSGDMSDATNPNLPPYYALAYIIKL